MLRQKNSEVSIYCYLLLGLPSLGPPRHHPIPCSLPPLPLSPQSFLVLRLSGVRGVWPMCTILGLVWEGGDWDRPLGGTCGVVVFGSCFPLCCLLPIGWRSCLGPWFPCVVEQVVRSYLIGL